MDPLEIHSFVNYSFDQNSYWNNQTNGQTLIPYFPYFSNCEAFIKEMI